MALEQHLAYAAHCAEVAVDLERRMSAEQTTVRPAARTHEEFADRVDETELVVNKRESHIAVKESCIHIDFTSEAPARAAFASQL